jgi:NADP-dependent alcohol dehydrogenase
VPFGTLTLPATGSEMNSGAVVTIESTKKNLLLEDPLCFQNSPFVTLQSSNLYQKTIAKRVVDAYTHVMEQYLTYPQKAIYKTVLLKEFCRPYLIGPSCGKPKIMPWHLTLCGVVPWL